MESQVDIKLKKETIMDVLDVSHMGTPPTPPVVKEHVFVQFHPSPAPPKHTYVVGINIDSTTPCEIVCNEAGDEILRIYAVEGLFKVRITK